MNSEGIVHGPLSFLGSTFTTYYSLWLAKWLIGRANSLDQLDAIPKRITKLEAIKPGNWNSTQNLDVDRLEFRAPLRKIDHLVGNVSLGRQPVHALFRSNMNLSIANLQPKSAPGHETFRLVDLGQTQNAAVKLTRRLFMARWDRQLHVMDSQDHVLSSCRHREMGRPTLNASKPAIILYTSKSSATENRMKGVGHMGRSIWAIVSGVVVASLWIAALEWLNGLKFPLPDAIDMQDKAAVGIHLAANPTMLAGVAGAYFVGSFMGGWIGGRTARRLQVRHGLIVGAVMFVFGLINLMDIPHPVWFWFVGQAVFLVGGALGGFVARLSAPRPTPALS